MNILSIGNSFSEDAQRYLHEIAKADRTELNSVNLYIGGCSLERHYENMLSDERAYELQYNGMRTKFFVSFSEALLNRDWDLITLQQVSHLSFDEESYHPYVEELAAYVRKNSPKAKLYIHQTWAYEDGSDRLLNVAKYDRADRMLTDIVKAYQNVSERIGADGIIPSGEMMASLQRNGIARVHRDTFHASLGLGRYALGLLWYHILCQKSIVGNGFSMTEEPITEEARQIVQACVEEF